MKKSRFSEEQIIAMLRDAESGTPVRDLEAWREDYKSVRPRSSLGYQTAEEYAAEAAARAASPPRRSPRNGGQVTKGTEDGNN